MSTNDAELDAIEKDLAPEEYTEIVLLSEAASRASQDLSNVLLSGYVDLDSCMDGGFREGDFTVISGIPGEGKTTLARMFTLNFAKQGIPSMWFSHEMTTRELWESFEKMGADPSLIAFVPMELEENTDWMFKHIKKAIKDHGIKAVFIDTLGDIVKSESRQKDLGNYATYLAQICKDLRKFAIENNILVFAVAHATKQTRTNTNETSNSDIANSNGIPAAATNIFHVWRSKDEENVTFVKIGKSRRDGTKKDWKFQFRFTDNKLEPEGRWDGFGEPEKKLWNEPTR